MDLDGTLISTSSEKELVLSLVREGRLSWRGFLRFLAAYAMHPARTLVRGKGWNRSYLRGMAPDTLRQHCRRLAAGLRRRIRPEVADMVASWTDAGARVVLITATLQPLAGELAGDCGATRVVASIPEESDGRLTGRLSGPRPWGRSKAELGRNVLEEISVSPESAVALGDSWSDRHIMRLCGRRVAVCPDRRLRRLAESEGWTVMDGRHTRWA